MRFSVLTAGSFAAAVLAQTPVTSVSPSQSSQIQAALISYAGSVISSPDIRGLGVGLALNNVPINSENLAALNPVPTSTGIDWASFANTPPSITSEPTWLPGLPSDLQSSVSSIQTSALNQAVNIVRGQLGLASTTIAAAATNTGGAGGATGTNAATPIIMGGTEGMLGAVAVGFGMLAAAL